MSTSNLKLALQEYDAQQRRQTALLEAQRIGNLIHIQEQQLVAARHLAKQRKHALRRQQQQLQQQQLQQLIQQQQQQSSQPAHYSVQCQPTLEALAESAVEDEDDSSQDNSAPCPLAARRAVRVAAKRASLLASSENNSASSSQQNQLEHTRSEPQTQPKPIRYVQHKRRPLEPFAVLAPRSQWKPDSHTNKCDNILCRKEFSLFGERRHHCRRCGNIFCAACLGNKEVLYDMRLASWITFPERLLASVFRPEDQHNSDDDEPGSPASLSLSSSFESGSSHGSTCSKSYLDAKPIKKQQCKAIWERGTNEHVPLPIPQAWRDQVIDLAQEHMVCNDCHDILHGRDTSTDKFYEQKAMMVQREEIAWALWLQGLDKWDTVLRKHGLTLRASPAQRKEDRKAAAFSARRGSNVSSATAVSTDSSSSSDSGSTKVDASVDFAGRPIHANLYAWPTAPASIRFTSKALEPAPKPAPRPKPTPSIFGTHNAHPMYLQTASRPSSSRQSSLLTLSDVQQKEQQHEEEEKMEEDRQKRYTAALQEFLCDAYAMGDICDEFQRIIYYDLPGEANWHQKITDDIWRWGMDRLSSWRGDSYGGW